MRLLTWNVWWRMGPWQQRQELLAEVIREVQPDVVCLQEAWSDQDGVMQGWSLGEPAGLRNVTWSENRQPGRWRKRLRDNADHLDVGLCIMSRWPMPVDFETTLPLAGNRDEGRTALGAVIDTPDGPLPLVTTHLASHPSHSAVRQAQVRAFAEFGVQVREHAEQVGGRPWPLILCGDLNAQPDSDEIRSLEGYLTAPLQPGLTFLDAWRTADYDDRGFTWLRENPHVVDWSPPGRIDYVFGLLDDIGRRGIFSSVRTVGARPGSEVWPSDHLGLLVDIQRP